MAAQVIDPASTGYRNSLSESRDGSAIKLRRLAWETIGHRPNSSLNADMPKRRWRAVFWHAA